MSKASLAAVLVTLLVLGTSSPSAADSDDSKFGPWSQPVNLAVLNSTFNDFGPGIVPNGHALYFSSDRPGGFGAADLYVTRRASLNAEWGAPVNLGAEINTTANETVPSFSRDGHRMFFITDRAGGLGMLDIWVSFRVNPQDDFGWQAPVNLGAPINTAFIDAGSALVEEAGREILFFNSDRPGGQGAHDFYMSVRQEDGSFGTPMLVAELNSAFTEQRITIRKDRLEVFFFSNRAGSDANDLWTSTREDRDDPWGAPTNLGAGVNSAANETQATISKDARTLIFASNRTGGVGGFDLYVTTRSKGG
jgi:hypothetical protein